MKIAAWNTECRLSGYQESGRGTAEHILREIEVLDADVLVLPEFYMNSLAPGMEDRLESLGYEIFETAYDDVGRSERDRRVWGEVHIGILSRLPVVDVETVRPGNIRNLLVCLVADPTSGARLRVIVTHLEDRSEAMRLQQAEGLVGIINSSDVPTVMLGDFNAMWRKGRARLIALRFMRWLALVAIHGEVRFALTRVIEMAAGKTLRLLVSRTGLRETDPRRRATATPKMRFTSYLPSVRLIQIDHMLVSSGAKTDDFKIAKDGGSDHRAISATLIVNSRKH